MAAAARVDQGHLSRIERGLAVASLDAVVALAVALGADASVRLFPTAGPRIHDHLQAPMVEAIVRRLDPRWRATPEVPVPAARGIIDLVLRLRGGEMAIACEVHSELRSLDLVLRRLAEKTAALADLVEPGTVASSMLVVRSTARTRQIALAYGATLQAAFPGSIRSAQAALTGPTAAWPGPTLLWARLDGGRVELLDRAPRGVAVGR